MGFNTDRETGGTGPPEASYDTRYPLGAREATPPSKVSTRTASYITRTASMYFPMVDTVPLSLELLRLRLPP